MAAGGCRRWYEDLSTHEGWFLIRTSGDQDKFRELPPEEAGLSDVS